ncbi:MAG: hypothetical protein AAFO95_10640 [Cyanobacteria bacterium J06600_6]
MNDNHSNYSPLIDRFHSDAPYIGLERIKLSIERGQEKNAISNFLYVFLLPGALCIYLNIKRIIKSQKNINSFRNTVHQEPILIFFATVVYGAMWWHFRLIAISFWSLFYQHYSWQEFFASLAQWNTLQALVLFGFNFFLSQLALSSFKLTPAFEDRYQFLKLLANARYEKPVVQTQAVNSLIRGKAEMMQNLINQTFTAMLAHGELDPETAKKVIDIVKNSYYEIVEDYGVDQKLNFGEAHLETEDFPALDDKKDENW